MQAEYAASSSLSCVNTCHCLIVGVLLQLVVSHLCCQTKWSKEVRTRGYHCHHCLTSPLKIIRTQCAYSFSSESFAFMCISWKSRTHNREIPTPGAIIWPIKSLQVLEVKKEKDDKKITPLIKVLCIVKKINNQPTRPNAILNKQRWATVLGSTTPQSFNWCKIASYRLCSLDSQVFCPFNELLHCVGPWIPSQFVFILLDCEACWSIASCSKCSWTHVVEISHPSHDWLVF